jgi:2'-5' RNA ligase
MRLFVAIHLPPDIIANLVALKTDIPDAAWVKQPALHLTLRFLGDGIDPIRLTPIKTALATVNVAPFTLALRGVGRFPPGNKRPARVLWAGVEEHPALIALQAQIERMLASVDFAPEERAYRPHITLARLKGEGNAAEVSTFLERHNGLESAPFTVDSFHLMSSLLTPEGAVYREEAEFPLVHSSS